MIIRKLVKIKKLPASHENPSSPGCLKKIIFAKNDFPKGYQPQMINWATIPQGRQFQLHYHQDMMEIFIIIKGHARMRVGNKYLTVKAGETIMVAPKEIHSMKNISKGDVEYYVVGLSRDQARKTITL